MTKYLIAILILITNYLVYGQQPVYDVASIPDSLRKNANVIKRYENSSFEVKDIDRATYKSHEIYTVLNKEGYSSLVFHKYTNKYIFLEEAEIRLYNAMGTQIGRYRKKDLNKQANTDGLVADGNVYFLEIPVSSYPVTVEYQFQIGYAGTLAYPSFTISTSGEAVQYSSFSAKVPVDIGLRFHEQKISLKPLESLEGSYKIYKWEAKNIKAQTHEQGSVNGRFSDPSILLAPNRFRHFNTYGELTSWKTFGEWGYSLIDGIDLLPEERVAFFKLMVKNAVSDREKAVILYDYLQKNFRYVSIQLGIGGVKPFPAQFTDEKKYGDCKGLSLYMLAMLKAVGVKSHIAFINALYDSEAVDPSFPCDRFDHVILCIPQPKDSIWLECTSNTNAFAVLGTFTENRNALLLTEKGGVLVATPRSKSSDNTLAITTTIELERDGSGITTSEIYGLGNFKEMVSELIDSKKDDQKELLVAGLGFKHPDDFSVEKKATETSQVEVKLAVEKIPQFSAGTKMFLSSRLHSIINRSLPKCENRTYDFYFRFPYQITDTTIYILPEGYSADVLPTSQKIQSEYGSYYSNYWFDKEKNHLVSTVRFVLNYHIIPAKMYQSVKKLFDEVASCENQKIVIKKS